MKHYLLISVFLLTATCFTLTAGPQHENMPAGSGEIQMLLNNLNEHGRVLYIAAHPDDENTRMIAYLSKSENVDVAYLSLNRGDGGQNLIGTEKGPLLGLLRTHELLSARSIDGGKQFFTRANDFGYSKTHEETLNIWDKDEVLSDMVFAIRKFRPHVMINRFPPLRYEYPTHGHHSASALLSEMVFDMAGDPEAFPEQLEYVDTWQPTRLYWDMSPRIFNRTEHEMDSIDKIGVDVGSYVPALGLSATEIAGMSRSEHKSQGFGAPQTRGEDIEYLEYVKGEYAESHLWEGIDAKRELGDNREEITALLANARDNFDPQSPTNILEYLLEAYTLAGDNHSAMMLKNDIQTTVAAICGLHMETVARDYSAVPGDSVYLQTHLINRSNADVNLESIAYSVTDQSYNTIEHRLQYNEELTVKDSFSIQDDLPVSQPFWLVEEQENEGMYVVEDQMLRILPEAPSSLYTTVKLSVEGVPFTFRLPFEYKWTDRVDGERYRDFIITPDITVNLREDVMVFGSDNPRDVSLRARAWKDDVEGALSLNLPEGWHSEPESVQVSLESKGDEVSHSFTIIPPAEADVSEMQVLFDNKPTKGFAEMDYGHVPVLNAWPDTETRLVRLDIDKQGRNIGYIMGPGDEVANNLEQINYNITMINADNIDDIELSELDAVIIGIRAYNTEEWLTQEHNQLMNYVEGGGRVIVQYQTTWGLLTQNIGPRPFTIGRGRITDYNAPVQMLNPDHSLLNTPNKLSSTDFEGWVQERGLYFAEDWDDEYTPLFAIRDPGEDPQKGSLIMTEYGEGVFFYTGISFFRQLPAGVPGAYRLLVNMISYESD